MAGRDTHDRLSRAWKLADGAPAARTHARSRISSHGPQRQPVGEPVRTAARRSLPGIGHVHRSEAAAGPGPRVPAVLVLHAGSGAAAARAAGAPHISPPLRKRGRRRVTPPCQRRAVPRSPRR